LKLSLCLINQHAAKACWGGEGGVKLYLHTL
jgi:hypothetical protein